MYIYPYWVTGNVGLLPVIAVLLVCLFIYCFLPSSKRRRKRDKWIIDYYRTIDPNFSYFGFNSAKTLPVILFVTGIVMFIIGLDALFEGDYNNLLTRLFFLSLPMIALGLFYAIRGFTLFGRANEAFNKHLYHLGFCQITRTSITEQTLYVNIDWNAYEQYINSAAQGNQNM